MPNTIDFNAQELMLLSEEERKVAIQILSEISKEGQSKTFDIIRYADYDEIPVDIETFLKDPRYLGKGLVNEEGKFTVFPYWVNLLKSLFPDPLLPAKYNTLALSGAIGLGKSFVAVLCGLYELYRMLCLKDPYLHYGLQPIDKITFAFMNITLDASHGVAWDKCQQLLQSSPWFMSKGTLSGSQNVVWNPPKGIELIAGSLSRHIIGRAVFWCLDGETEIATNTGNHKLKDLVDKRIQVYNVTEDGSIQLSDVCTVKPTDVSVEEYIIELADGTSIKCTPTHRFMLSDGTYKQAQYLTEEDDILEFIPYGYVYRITNQLNKKFYIGKRVCSHFDESYWGGGKLITAAINKYGKNNFTREILAWAKTKDELERLEQEFIDSTHAIKEGYNLAPGGTGGDTVSNTMKITNGIEEKHISICDAIPEGWRKGSKMLGVSHHSEKYKESWTPERRQKHSVNTSGERNSQFHNGAAHRGDKNGRYGKPVSIETRKKISDANTGKKCSDTTKKQISEKLLGRKKKKGFGESVRRTTLGKRAYNNGEVNIWVMANKPVPEGFVEGWIKK